MAISDLLIPALRKNFPGRGLQLGSPPDPVAVFPPVHPEVGEVAISDDASEATVYVGEITHGHFNPYDSSMSPDQIAATVTEEVVGFLKELFADRVVMWSYRGGGGWYVPYEGVIPQDIPVEAEVFLWSGPVRRATHGGGRLISG